MLKFEIKQVLELIKTMEANDKVTLVKDHGVYLMNLKPGVKSKIVYAKGYDPNDDGIEEFWDDQQEECGGDDFACELFTRDQFINSLKQASERAKYLSVKVYEDRIETKIGVR